MAADTLMFNLILNIGLLVLVANLLSKWKFIQTMLLQERRDWKSQMALVVIFGGVIILSTYTGIDTGDYVLNTRVIGAMAAGLLGGPIVGLYAALLGAIYVYVCSEPQIFAMAAAFSTMLFGLLGGGFYPYFQRGKWKYRDLFVLTCFAEVCDMVVLLRFSPSFQMALGIVAEVAFPMIVVNAVGILLFISSFNTVFIQQDLESSRKLQQASELSQKCLPLLCEGLGNQENIRRLASVLLDETRWAGVMIVNQTEILEWQQKETRFETDGEIPIPEAGREAMETGRLVTMQRIPRDAAWREWMDEYSVAAAPFIMRDKAIGCVIVWMKKKWVSRQSELELLQHLVSVGSFQLGMAELERQQVMRQKAEFKALQFQVNPHFLFNALNTISCVCREDAGRARELLVILADYFRYHLHYDDYMSSMEEEILHVRDYLEIEKARYEDKLEVTYEIPDGLDIRIPTLILQPIVENAVKYGIDRSGRRIVRIEAREQPESVIVRVSDRGPGVPEEVQEKLIRGEPIGRSIGLSNVHQRMKSIYGEQNGVRITSTDRGTSVELCFAYDVK